MLGVLGCVFAALVDILCVFVVTRVNFSLGKDLFAAVAPFSLTIINKDIKRFL